jgi:uncharacterized membrane protein YdbT with pleckstrin-like domain
VELMAGEELLWSGVPSWRATLSFYLKWGLVALLPLLLVLLSNGLLGTDLSVFYGAVITIAALALVVLVGWLMRRTTHYTVTTKRISTLRGLLSKTENTAHIDRVQNISIRQTAIDRLLKVGVVDFDTASDDPADTFRFFGVDDPQRLRNRVSELIARREDAEADPQGIR